jgi:hypothetical protein
MEKAMELTDKNSNWRVQRKWMMIWAAFLGGILLFGCNSSDHHDDPQSVNIEIDSDWNFDGDIAFSENPDKYDLSTAKVTHEVIVGIEPGGTVEYRGFFDFSLTPLPLAAKIEEATLYLPVSGMSIADGVTSVPLSMNLVHWDPPNLVGRYYDLQQQPAILTMGVNILDSDVGGGFVPVDVTTLLDEVQQRGYDDFQLRLLLDLYELDGLVVFDDSNVNAPYLAITYY